MRILTAMMCAVAVVVLVGCGGSSYLSESEDVGELSTMTFTASGGPNPDGSSTAKDIVLTHVTGDATNNSGDSYTDAGVHACSFGVVSTDDAVMGVDDGDTQTCADPLNCAVCTIVNGTWSGPDPDPNCSISCVINAIPRDALIDESLNITYTDDILLRTTVMDSSGGVVRIDGALSSTAMFNGSYTQFIEELPDDGGSPSSCEGIVIVDSGALENCGDGTANITNEDLNSTDFWREYGIMNTVTDADASSYDAFLSDGDAWVSISVEVYGSIDLTNLHDPDGISESYDGGYVSTNAGMWHDSDNAGDTLP